MCLCHVKSWSWDQKTDFVCRHERTICFITFFYIAPLVLKVNVYLNPSVEIFHLLNSNDFRLICFCSFLRPHVRWCHSDLLQVEDKKWWRIYLFTCSHVCFLITFFLTLSFSLPSTLSIYPNQRNHALSVGKYYTVVRENSCGSMTRDSFALCQVLLVALNVNIWIKPRK